MIKKECIKPATKETGNLSVDNTNFKKFVVCSNEGGGFFESFDTIEEAKIYIINYITNENVPPKTLQVYAKVKRFSIKMPLSAIVEIEE